MRLLSVRFRIPVHTSPLTRVGCALFNMQVFRRPIMSLATVSTTRFRQPFSTTIAPSQITAKCHPSYLISIVWKRPANCTSGTTQKTMSSAIQWHIARDFAPSIKPFNVPAKCLSSHTNTNIRHRRVRSFYTRMTISTAPLAQLVRAWDF